MNLVKFKQLIVSMKTILVPTDFSNAAEKACEYAANLATAFKARVILLHAYSFSAAGTYVMIDVNDMVLKRARTALKTQQEEISRQFPTLRLEGVCRQGLL